MDITNLPCSNCHVTLYLRSRRAYVGIHHWWVGSKFSNDTIDEAIQDTLLIAESLNPRNA